MTAIVCRYLTVIFLASVSDDTHVVSLFLCRSHVSRYICTHATAQSRCLHDSVPYLSRSVPASILPVLCNFAPIKDAKYCDDNICVCVCVCLFVSQSKRPQVFQTSRNFLYVLLAAVWLVLLWRQWNTLCISGSVDDVMFTMRVKLAISIRERRAVANSY